MSGSGSIKSKAQMIDFSGLPGSSEPKPAEATQPASPAAPPVSRGPKTAPGMLMAQAVTQRSELLREVEDLRGQVRDLSAEADRAKNLEDELRAWDGALASKRLDPKLVLRSRWANRDVESLKGSDFEELKLEIEQAGGNVQPIKVRPLSIDSDGIQRYEIIYGHRRHQACLELGLPVLALIDNVDDPTLFVEMDRENRNRKNLSAWEQGVMYSRALAEGLFPSNKKLAAAIGIDVGQLGKAMAIAELPDVIVKSFATPLDIQFRWAKPLSDAWKADPDAVKRVAAAIATQEPRPAAKDIFDRLAATTSQDAGTPRTESVVVNVGGQEAATISLDRKGRASIQIAPGRLPKHRLKELATFLEKLLAEPERHGKR